MHAPSSRPPPARPFGREVASLLRLALPLIAGQLFGIGTDVVISVLAGHLGAGVLAAVALGSSIWIVMFVAVMGMMMSLQPTVAALDGAGRRQDAAPLLGNGLLLGLFVGSLAGLLLACAGPVLAARVVGSAAILPDALGFLRGAALSLPAFGVLAACRGFSEGLSMPRPSMVCGGLGLLALGPIGYTLIYGAGPVPGLGATGAGLAITATLWLQALAYLGWIRGSGRYPTASRPAGRGLDWPTQKGPDLAIIAGLIRLGAPIAGTLLMEVGMFTAATFMVGQFGAVAVAAHQVAVLTAAVFFMVPLGVAMAVTVRVGRAVGQADQVAIRRAGLAGFAIVLACQGGSLLLMLFGAAWFAHLFTHDPAVITLGASLISLAAVFQLSDGTQAVAMGALRGLRDTRRPMLMALLAYWGIGIPLGAWLAFGLGWGVAGIWGGLIGGLTLAALLLTTRFVGMTLPGRLDGVPAQHGRA